jgi:hypothetical protein
MTLQAYSRESTNWNDELSSKFSARSRKDHIAQALPLPRRPTEVGLCTLCHGEEDSGVSLANGD